LPLLSDEPEQAVDIAKDKLATYHQQYAKHYASGMRAKLGLTRSMAEDQCLVDDLLALMTEDRVDFTILFRQLCAFSTDNSNHNQAIRGLFIQRERYDQWAQRYRQRLSKETSADHQRLQRMRQTNPKYVLRNYLAEIAIRKAEDDQDYSEIDRLLNLLQHPFDENPEYESYAGFPPQWANRITVSCSS
jgi:uncharacterized protein YdiU (UPF0061 family)